MTWTFALVWLLIAILFIISILLKKRLYVVAQIIRFIAIILFKIALITLILLLLGLIIKSDFIIFIIGVILTIEIFLNF